MNFSQMFVLILPPLVLFGANVEEIIELRKSGFDESEILQLVDYDSPFGAKDFIKLKKADFSTDFIVDLKSKTGPKESTSKPSTNEESLRNEIVKFKANYARAIAKLSEQSYSTPGLFAHDGEVLKRNGFDESLDAPKRDLPRMRDLLLSASKYFIDRGTINALDIDDLLEAWLGWKVISIRNIAHKQMWREEFIPIPDDYDDTMLKAESIFEKTARDIELRIAPSLNNSGVDVASNQDFNLPVGNVGILPPNVRMGFYEPLNFSVLTSFEYDVNWERDGRNFNVDDFSKRVPVSIRKFGSKSFSIDGFMVPVLVDEQSLVKEFLLMPDQLSCCYGQTPKANEWIVVHSDRGVEANMDRLLRVRGTLSVEEKWDKEFFLGLYHIDLDEIVLSKLN